MPLINRCGGGGGTPQLCGQVENFKVIPGTTALTAVLSWTAPSPDEDNSFVGARIVRKTGSAPTGINDGTVVYEGTALSYTDTGLTDGTTYYYRAFAYNAKKKYQTEYRVVSLVATTLTIGATLNDTTWAQIRAVSDAGIAASVWSVGDTKSIVVNGSVYASHIQGGITYFEFNNVAVDAFIIGFDHNAAIEGTNRIHFHIGKQNDKQVGLSSGSGSASFYMFGNVWSTCGMREDVLGSNKTKASSPGKNNLLAALPSDLRAVMKTCSKYSVDHSTTIAKTTDILPLLSAIECFGNSASTIDVAGNYQKQYDYYKAGNSLLHYLNDGRYINWSTGKKYTQMMFLRDCTNSSSSSTYEWWAVDDGGNEYRDYATSNSLLAPIFFV